MNQLNENYDLNTVNVTLEVENRIEELKSFNETYMRLKLTAQAKIDYYQNKLDELTKDFEEKKVRIENEVKNLMLIGEKQGIIKETKTLKKLETISGVAVLTKSSKTIVKDDNEFMIFLQKNHPNFIETKEVSSIKWMEFKKQLSLTESGKIIDSDGQIVDGLSLKDTQEKFEIKLK